MYTFNNFHAVVNTYSITDYKIVNMYVQRMIYTY